MKLPTEESVTGADESPDAHFDSPRYHSELEEYISVYGKGINFTPSTTAPSTTEESIGSPLFNPPPRSPWVVHFWLFTIQVLFGGGVVIAKLGLPTLNPLLFAFIREGCAAPIIYLVARIISPDYPLSLRHSLRVFFPTGVLLFGNQLNFIIGLKLADETSAAAWQPSQPILTAIIATFMGLEILTVRKVVGIFLGVMGALILALGSGWNMGPDGWRFMIGNICFFFNCAAHAVYVISSRSIIERERIHPVYCVAFSYMITACLMFSTLVGVGQFPALFHAICHDCDPSKPLFHVPLAAVPAIAYWVLFTSVLSYIVITWATVYVEPSSVSIWTVCQPLTAAAFTTAIIVGNLDGGDNLSAPGLNSLGAVPIILGLILVVTAARRPREMDLNRQYSALEVPCEFPSPDGLKTI